jgi:hypothetical protein
VLTKATVMMVVSQAMKWGGSNYSDSDGSTVEGERVVQAGRAGDPREPVAEEDPGGGNVTSDSEGN